MKENTKAMEKALANVLALTKTTGMTPGMFNLNIKGQEYYIVTDGYRIVRKFSDVPALPHYCNTWNPASMERFFRDAKKDEEMPLPTVQELKAWIKEKKIRRSNPGKTTFCIDGFVHVNPFFLLDMIQGLPGCKAYRPQKSVTPIYFQAENGDGLLCPVNIN